MLTPYDWQEGIGNRAQYVESRLAQGAAVLAVSLDAGILIYTYRRQSKKIFDIYDRLAFAGMGQQADIESIRVAALEFASREGFQRSEADVTIQRVVTAVAAPIRTAFGDFSRSPIVAASLFAELGDSADSDRFFTIDFDGDYRLHREYAVLAGSEWKKPDPVEVTKRNGRPEKQLEPLDNLWKRIMSRDGAAELDLEGLTPEAVLMERNSLRENIFVTLTD